MRIVVDGMGGDNAPEEIVKGAVQAAAEIEDEIVIIGDEKLIKEELKKCGYGGKKSKGHVSVAHAEEVIENDDAPVKAVRTKKKSSMVLGLNMVKDGEADMFISAGNTGALMAGSLFILGRIQGIDRPALASVYPNIGGEGASLLVDAGANSECKPGNLLEFGIMGSIYMEKVLGREKPKIGLVNIGAEETKGSSQVKLAHGMLAKSSVNFIGNVEARELSKGDCDVIVCDGFVGNVILKLTEGLAMDIFKLVKSRITSGIKASIGALLMKDKLMSLKEEFDYSEYGGAPVLGVKGPVVKMHGSSLAKAVKNTIIKAIPYAKNDVVGIIQNSVLEIEEIVEGDE